MKKSLLRLAGLLALATSAICADPGTSARPPAPPPPVKMQPFLVPIPTTDEFVLSGPKANLSPKPYQWKFRRPDQVLMPEHYSKWLIPSRLGVKDGDEIIAVQGTTLTPENILQRWKLMPKQGEVIHLMIKSPDAKAPRAIEFVYTLKPAEQPRR